MPVQAPNANVVCERFLGSVRRECLDPCWPKTRLLHSQLLTLLSEWLSKSATDHFQPHRFLESIRVCFLALGMCFQCFQAYPPIRLFATEPARPPSPSCCHRWNWRSLRRILPSSWTCKLKAAKYSHLDEVKRKHNYQYNNQQYENGS